MEQAKEKESIREYYKIVKEAINIPNKSFLEKLDVLNKKKMEIQSNNVKTKSIYLTVNKY